VHATPFTCSIPAEHRVATVPSISPFVEELEELLMAAEAAD
jgi:hypothetical protein